MSAGKRVVALWASQPAIPGSVEVNAVKVLAEKGYAVLEVANNFGIEADRSYQMAHHEHFRS